MDAESHLHFEARRHLRTWAALLVGPVAAFLQLLVVYVLSSAVRDDAGRAVLHVVSFGCAALALAGHLRARRGWLATGGRWPEDADEDALAHRRFLDALAMLVSALFFLVTLAQGSAAFVLDPRPH